MFRRTDAAISPTALYTGTVWRRNGLSHPAFATFAGTALWTGLVGPRRAASLLGAPDLDALLLARHHSIDTLLERAIDAGEISQVVEIAAGLSPRGWRFTSRYGSDLTYVETDLPGMTRRKADLLARAELMGPGHRVRVLDAFAPTGPNSLDALADELDPDQGTAVITEGLINYFPMSHVLTLWNSVGSTLHRFPRGLYLSDLHLDQAPGAVTATAKFLIRRSCGATSTCTSTPSRTPSPPCTKPGSTTPSCCCRARSRASIPRRASTATTSCGRPPNRVDDQDVGGSLTSESCSSSTLTSLNVSTLTFLANRAGR